MKRCFGFIIALIGALLEILFVAYDFESPWYVLACLCLGLVLILYGIELVAEE